MSLSVAFFRSLLVATIVALAFLTSVPTYGQDKKPDATAKTTVVVKPDATATSQPTSEPSMPNEVPKDVAGAVDKGKEAISLAKEGKWFSFSAGVIWLLMFVFKLLRKNVEAMKNIPKRVLWIIVPILSVIAMLLAKFQGDLSWSTAWIVLTSGPVMALLNDFVKRGVLGKEPVSPVSGKAA